MDRREADEDGRLILRERQLSHLIVNRITADAELHGRYAEIPATQLGDRQIQPDPGVNDSIVVAERGSDVPLDHEDRVRFAVDAAFERHSFVGPEVDQVEVHGLEAGNLKNRQGQIATWQRFIGYDWHRQKQNNDDRRHPAHVTPPVRNQPIPELLSTQGGKYTPDDR